MTTIGIPLGQERWWEHCTWPDGSPAHIQTIKEMEEVWGEEYNELLELFCERLLDNMKKTLDEITTQEEMNESLVCQQQR